MHVLVTLFFIGLVVCVGLFVFELVITVVATAVMTIGAGIWWAINRLLGR